METLTFRPKRDRRTQPRIPPTDIADRAYELYRQGGEHVKATTLPLRRGDVLRTRRTPEDGDIVVREQQREGTLVFVLHTAPGADQHVLRNREEAVAQAVTFAKRQHVGAWLTDEGYDFVLLEDFRVVESV
jgi:hypothetical protein